MQFRKKEEPKWRRTTMRKAVQHAQEHNLVDDDSVPEVDAPEGGGEVLAFTDGSAIYVSHGRWWLYSMGL